MKNSQKGFIVPLVLILIAIVVIGGGAYVYTQHRQVSAPISNNNQQATSTTNTTNSATTSVSIQATTSVKVVPPKPKVIPVTLSQIELKYKIKKYFNDTIGFCGPPVMRPSYQDDQLALFPTIQAN